MPNSELQREYALADALNDIVLGAARNDPAQVERASEWVGRRIAELEQKAAASAMIVRIAALEVRPGDALLVNVREKLDVSMKDWFELVAAVKAQFRAELGFPVPVLVVDGADISVVRTSAPDPAPPTTERDQAIADEAVARTTGTYAGPPWQEAERKTAPVHPDPTTRLATGSEEVCRKFLAKFGRDVYCARPKWHDGPHMDGMAIAHAGKAGEVWE